MAQKRLTAWQKVSALVPLALLSGAWTTSLAAGASASASTPQDTQSLPDGTTLPHEAIEAPATVTSPGSIAPGIPTGGADRIVESASLNGIPAAALAAYQRSEQVINTADPSCNLSWQLLAAIGRVESDHGRYGGNVLGDDGKSRPGIYGIPLDGSNGTAEIADTDGGRYDDDVIYDRAVGPMQFIPSTWSIVGVDGDSDGARDPQDIDDAALASAVYLCSGEEDLSTGAGQRAAVYRYNHSSEYVDLVLAIMDAYLDGEYSAVPNGVATSTVFTPSGSRAADRGAARPKAKSRKPGQRDGSTSGGSAGASDPSAGDTQDLGSTDGTGDTTAPTAPETTSDPLGTIGDAVQDAGDTVGDTTQDVTDPVTDSVDDATAPLDEATGGVLSESEATLQCTAEGLLAGTPSFEECVANLTG